MNQINRAYSIDSNIILRYLLKDNPDLYSKAADILKRVHTGEIIVYCDPVNLAEIVYVLSSFYKQPNELIWRNLEPILANRSFVVRNKDLYLKALRLFGKSLKHFGDACACATALQECDGRLLSFDTGIPKGHGIKRQDHID